MATKEFHEGAEMVGEAAKGKFNDIGKKVNDLKGEFSEYAEEQANINQIIIDRSDEHEERIRKLEENRYFVRSSRRGIEDLDPVQQDRVVGWLQKLVKEFNSRGFPVNKNQQKFLENLLKFLGIIDEVVEVPDLSMMENFGNSELHEIIYKIFLIFTYLYDNNFDILTNFDDVSGLFKLTSQNKIDIQRLLAEERIPLLGLDGLVNIYDPSRALNSFKPQTLFDSVREIHTHPLLDMGAAEDVKKLYIQGFALLTDGKTFSEEQYNYLKSIANALKCASALENIDQLCTAPQKFQVRNWTAALDNDMLKYSWLVDGVMVLCQLPEISKDTVKTDILEEAAKSLRILQVNDFISPAINLCLAKNGTDLYKAIRKLHNETNSWEHILEYRNLNLQGAFDNIIMQLNRLSLELCAVGMTGSRLLLDIDLNTSAYADTGSLDEGFFDNMMTKASRAIVESGRSSAEEKLKAYCNSTKSFIRDHFNEYNEANSVLSTFNIENIYPKDTIIEPDLNNSALNDNWYDDYIGYYDKIEKTLESCSEATSLLTEQLVMFEKGQYHTSVLECKKIEKEEKDKQKQAEIDAKRYIEIRTEGGDYCVSMSWKEIDGAPFDLDAISKIGYAGGNWFIMADEPYCLDNNLNWNLINNLPVTYVSEIFHVNGYIVIQYRGNMWFSKDCKNWLQANLPTDEDILALIHYKDKYVLFTKYRKTYSYTEKGFFFDSEKEGYYYSTIAWHSPSLDLDWKRWDDASYTHEGMVLDSNISCNDSVIIGGFSYDFSFKTDKKKSSSGACVAYFKNARWKDATWPNDINNRGNFYFLNNHGIFVNTYNKILISDNAYEWKIVEGITSKQNGGICGNVFITIPDSNGQSLISLDGLSICQLTVSEKGNWNKFCYGDSNVLGLYAKSEHESFLQLGTLNVIRK